MKRLLVLLAVMAAPAWAASSASVEAVEMPAWLERGGRSQPLAVGMAIAHGDRIRTGAGSRVHLALAEGSRLKIGENAKLALFSHSLRPKAAFRGAIEVAGGAFRFTSGPGGRGAREISIRVGAATVRVTDGADVWGRSSAQEDLVCLVEGSIDLRHPALAEPASVGTPLSFFQAPHGGAARPVALLKPQELLALVRQTEIETGTGAAHKDGRWTLRLGRHATQALALARYDEVRAAGFAARIQPVAAGEAWHYDVMLAGFRDPAEAAAAAARLKASTGIAAEVPPGG